MVKIYKGTNKSIDSTVHKTEYVTYPSNLSHVLEIGTTSSEQKVHFHVSGNCLLDGKNSYSTEDEQMDKLSFRGHKLFVQTLDYQFTIQW